MLLILWRNERNDKKFRDQWSVFQWCLLSDSLSSHLGRYRSVGSILIQFYPRTHVTKWTSMEWRQNTRNVKAKKKKNTSQHAQKWMRHRRLRIGWVLFSCYPRPANYVNDSRPGTRLVANIHEQQGPQTERMKELNEQMAQRSIPHAFPHLFTQTKPKGVSARGRTFLTPLIHGI